MINKSINTKIFIRLLLFLIIVLFVFFSICLIVIEIQWSYPNITYKGNRTVPQEDIICLEKITLRNLKIDECRDYNNKRRCQYYIVKNKFISREELHKELSSFCYSSYDNQNEFDVITFHFFKECREMPWFWNDKGYFPDLEWNQKNKGS